MSVTIDENVLIRANLTVAGGFNPAANSIPTSALNTSTPLAVTGQKQQYEQRLTQVHGSAATAERRAIHIAYGDGSVLNIATGVVVACTGNATITIDLYKNGVTELSAPIVLDSTNTAYSLEWGTIASPNTYVEDDVYEVVITVNAGTGALGQGLFVHVWFDEDPI